MIPIYYFKTVLSYSICIISKNVYFRASQRGGHAPLGGPKKMSGGHREMFRITYLNNAIFAALMYKSIVIAVTIRDGYIIIANIIYK